MFRNGIATVNKKISSISYFSTFFCWCSKAYFLAAVGAIAFSLSKLPVVWMKKNFKKWYQPLLKNLWLINRTNLGGLWRYILSTSQPFLCVLVTICDFNSWVLFDNAILSSASGFATKGTGKPMTFIISFSICHSFILLHAPTLEFISILRCYS